METALNLHQDTTADWVRQHNNYFEAPRREYGNSQSDRTVYQTPIEQGKRVAGDRADIPASDLREPN